MKQPKISMTEMKERQRILELAVLEAVDLAVMGWRLTPPEARRSTNIWIRLADLRAVVTPHGCAAIEQSVKETIAL